MGNWTHAPVVVQCQTDGCSLSSKDGAVVWQSFAQLAAGCLTFLEMAVDDCRCPHILVHFGVISGVNFIVWSLYFTIVIELSLGFLFGEYTCAHPLNDVFLGTLFVRSWWNAGCPHGQTNSALISALCRGHGCLFPETNGRGRSRIMPPLPIKDPAG